MYNWLYLFKKIILNEHCFSLFTPLVHLNFSLNLSILPEASRNIYKCSLNLICVLRQLQPISNIRSEIIKSLSLYYYTFVDLLDFKDNVCELLTTMDACQLHLDIVSCFFFSLLLLKRRLTYIAWLECTVIVK